jgi:hypothetical protein
MVRTALEMQRRDILAMAERSAPQSRTRSGPWLAYLRATPPAPAEPPRHTWRHHAPLIPLPLATWLALNATTALANGSPVRQRRATPRRRAPPSHRRCPGNRDHPADGHARGKRAGRQAPAARRTTQRTTVRRRSRRAPDGRQRYLRYAVAASTRGLTRSGRGPRRRRQPRMSWSGVCSPQGR